MRYGLFSVWPELFNERAPEVTEYTLSDEQMASIGFDRERMSINSAYQEEPVEQPFSLGDY
jgi:hypothetical protein